ncbi:DNA (cytosine-5-)-methyltransferase [Blastococcus sp. CT_GayMR19]|uniref:DNA cytosine methyltransferase n=1 Tax=Blastococcus sp. CT_GayMR19 TaxID=2559608 RepID=UPI0010737B82|nr:DNA (cytosine-5-)-methyltransferase [Blastococcus sp. CT_GayMR19]TFV74391.1 DNA (cytosine-5-)-methyltransferase [Blastococcus sp. CT_GayMR19]
MTDLNVVEICAGAGGQSLGLHLAGFRHSLAVELDATAAATLRSNLARLQPEEDSANIVAVGDVASEVTWRPEDYRGKVSLLAGGVPCPPFSVAGKQLGAGDERDLFAWAVNLTGRVRPEALLLENVRGLSDARFGGYRQAVVDQLESLGYRADWKLLHAKDYGVPQLRPRMVLVALREECADYFEWPDPKETAMTVGTTLARLMAVNGFPYIDEWVERADSIAPTIVGGSKKHGGADLGPTRAKRAWESLWVDAHGLADHAPDEAWDRAANPRGPKLTTEMVARLQGWLDEPEYEWHFTGLKTSRYRQIGNAFPPPVARAVGDSIARALRKERATLVPRPDLAMHDEVYRVLRDSGERLTAYRISQRLGGRLSIVDVEKRIQLLKHDFEVHESGGRGRRTYMLGDWRAFQGQADHLRHEAFAERKRRGRIS